MAADISEKLLSDKEVKLKDKLWDETKKMWVIAAPAMFTKFSTFGVTVISHSFVGHIGSNELAAYALVSTVLLRFGNGILVLLLSSLTSIAQYYIEMYNNHDLYLCLLSDKT